MPEIIAAWPYLGDNDHADEDDEDPSLSDEPDDEEDEEPAAVVDDGGSRLEASVSVTSAVLEGGVGGGLGKPLLLLLLVDFEERVAAMGR